MILMDILSPITATTAAVAILLSIVYYFIKIRDVLPGPKGWPYLGLYPLLNNETCHLQLEEIGKKYGDLFSFTYLGKLIINLGSIKAIREVHINKSDCFSGRFTDFNLLTYILADGVAMVNGEAWKVLRKYFIQAFKEYGLTNIKDNTAGPIYDSLSRTIEELNTRKGTAFNVIELLTERCMGTMRNVLFGEDGISDEKIRELNNAYSIVLEMQVGVNLLLLGPLGRLIFYIHPGYRHALSQHKLMTNMLMDIVKNIESSLDENHPTCVVENYYKEKSDRRRQNDPTWKYFSDKALVSSLAQFIGDGILSVAYFIGCFLYALVEHPEEQEQVYRELHEIVGPTRMPTIEDKSKLPYTNAFMNEVIRTSTFFPLFPSLGCTKETTIRGYRIPKGSITLLNFWAAHHDPEIFDDPYKFDPSRYISTPGKLRAELPVSFGMGKRACTGEAFVMMQAFLYLTSIVKHFQISGPENSTTKSELFLMTGNMELCIHPRNEK